MKAKTILLILAIIAIAQGAKAQTFEWAKQMGGANSEYGESIVVDASGNVYTTGYFEGTADFDPGPGTFNLTSAGLSDVFISKLDASGNFVWAKQLGGSSNARGYSIAVDASGNVYTTGSFSGTADFDPGQGTFNLTSAGLSDVFISKLDASGSFVWAKQLGGSYNDVGNSIAVDAFGNVYTTGSFWETANFDPGPGTFNLTSSGGIDIFISKLDASGNFVWAKQLGGFSYDDGRSIAVDASGNVYTTGYFEGTADFDPGPGTFNLTSTGDSDIFISKLDASGNFVWAKQLGGTSGDYGYSIAVDASGNVYTTGSFYETADFDQGPGTFNLTSSGGIDIFISKLDASGNFVWAKQLGGTSGDFGYSIAVDASGNVYTTGDFEGTADFDPGQGTFNLTSVGNVDIFISKLDASGNFVWAKQLGGTANDYGLSITVDASGNVYTTGSFQGTADFDPGPDTFNLISHGGDDIFVHKLSQCATTYGTDTQTACDSYLWIDGNTYTTSNNTATYTLTNAAGCDSVVTLNLTINPSYTIVFNESIWDYQLPYYWEGSQYWSAGTYYKYYQTVEGCDSILQLNLTSNPSFSIWVNKEMGTAAQANWTLHPDAVRYEVRYSDAGGGGLLYPVAQTTGNIRKLTNLLPDTDYLLEIRAFDGSAWTPWGFYQPIVFNSGSIDFWFTKDIGTKALLHWTELENVTSYILQYRLPGSSWQLKGIYDNSEAVMGALQEATDYEFRVIPRFDNTGFWFSAIGELTTNMIMFSTNYSGGTSVDFSWDPVINPLASSYFLQLREVGAGAWGNYSASINSRTVNDLTAGSDYEYRLVVRYDNVSWGTTGVRSLGVQQFSCGDNFNDARDGNVYSTVQIGNQCWMAENLKYLPSVTGSQTYSETIPYYYVYDYEGFDVNAAKATYNYQTYGVLYNWPAAMAVSTTSNSNPSGVQGACPDGWHLPSDAEWIELRNYLGGESVAGGKLKATGTSQWLSPNTGATNETGFTGLPGGINYFNFEEMGILGWWWTSTEHFGLVWSHRLIFSGSELEQSIFIKEGGLSVRCIKDITGGTKQATSAMNDFSIKIYPNPVSDLLSVEINSTVESTHMWQLYDMSGKLVMSGENQLTQGDNNFLIETAHLSAGLYLLQSNVNGVLQTSRIIKQ
jgi:uncharacterized protein (TIGR02145 family)